MTKHNFTSSDIAKLNDLLRTTMISNKCNKVILTPTVSESEDREKIISTVRNFNSFCEDNDPYEEHDCSVFEVNEKKYIWKIDYLDHNFLYGLAPYEELVCRQLTIMHSSEY